jgi:hypothetical protein
VKTLFSLLTSEPETDAYSRIVAYRPLYGTDAYIRFIAYRPLYGTGVNSGIGERLDQHCTVFVELASSHVTRSGFCENLCLIGVIGLFTEYR